MLENEFCFVKTTNILGILVNFQHPLLHWKPSQINAKKRLCLIYLSYFHFFISWLDVRILTGLPSVLPCLDLARWWLAVRDERPSWGRRVQAGRADWLHHQAWPGPGRQSYYQTPSHPHTLSPSHWECFSPRQQRDELRWIVIIPSFWFYQLNKTYFLLTFRNRQRSK